MARRKELRNCTVEVLDGFNGTGAVNDATLAATDTTMDVDTLSLADSRKIVPVGAHFTTASIATIRTVTATQNSQQWTVTITGAPTGGTFALTFNSQTTAAIAFDAAASAVQSALEALSGVSSGDVVVSGSAGGPYTITAAGNLKNISTNTLTSDGSLLTGGTSPDAVTATVQDGTTTWSLTFTPAIASGSVPSDDDVITFYPRSVTMKVGEGNVDYTKTKAPIIDLDRGDIDGARRGNQEAMQVNFTYVFDWMRSSTGEGPTVDEALEQEGEASDWLTAAADKCEPYQVTIRIVDAPDCGSEEAEVMLFKYFMPQTVNPTFESGLVNVSGICVTTKPVFYRVTNNANTYGIIYS